MFEAKLKSAALLKKILESIKDLVTDGNFDCSPAGIALQAMDSSHVSLVAMLLRKDGFQSFRCDRTIPLGISLISMYKILKCAGNNDSVTIKADEKGDNITFIFESESTCSTVLDLAAAQIKVLLVVANVCVCVCVCVCVRY
jgi:proliferating cell nuclear antigen